MSYGYFLSSALLKFLIQLFQLNHQQGLRCVSFQDNNGRL